MGHGLADAVARWVDAMRNGGAYFGDIRPRLSKRREFGSDREFQTTDRFARGLRLAVKASWLVEAIGRAPPSESAMWVGRYGGRKRGSPGASRDA
jgi:hypothetical protein